MSAKKAKETRRKRPREIAAAFGRIFTANLWLKVLALAIAIAIYASLREEAEAEAAKANASAEGHVR